MSAIASGACVPETGDDVVVHEANRLHEGVANRRADETEPAPPEVSTEGI
jgi:hypothetical protein